MWLDIVKDLALCGAFALVLWAPLGRCILKRFGTGKLPDLWSVCIPVGMGTWGLLILALGLVGLLYKTAVVGVAALLFWALGLHRHLRAMRFLGDRPPLSWPARAGVAILCAVSVGHLFTALTCSLAPEAAFDALNVHLPYARDAALTHRAGFAHNNWSSVMPALPLMSYISAFVFSGQTLAKLCNFLCYALCGGVLYGYVQPKWGQLRAIAAAALFWSCPIALYEAGTALIDLQLTIYSAIAILALLEWTARDEQPFLWLSAGALGLALGCKYHAAFWIVPALFVIAWHTLVVRRQGGRCFLRRASSYVLISFLLFLPWLFRAWCYTGNPVFPFANQIFKSPYFPPSMERAALAVAANEGVGHSWQALLALPWTVTFHPQPFRGTPGAIFLFGMLLVVARRKSPQIRYGLIFVAWYFYSWALTFQEIRYLLPLVPLLAVLTAVGTLGIELKPASERTDRGIPLALRRFATAAGFAVLLAGTVTAFPPVYRRFIKEWTYWDSYQAPFSYILGRQSSQEYLQRDVPSIYVYDYINAHLGPRDRILLLNDASQFYSHVPTLYSFTVEGEDLLLQETESGVGSKLKEYGISHVLLNYNGIAPLPGITPRLGVYYFLDKDFQQRQLETVYSKNNVVLYRVRY